MTGKTTRKKKVLKVAGIIAGVFIALLIAFHFWVVHHAEEIIQDLVSSRSNGKIKLQVKNFKFNWFSKKMELEDAVFFTADSSNVATSYKFSIEKVKLTVTSLFPVIFQNKIEISKFKIENPDIVVTLQKPKPEKNKNNNSSIPQEMGEIYKSIQDAITELKVKKFEIENATFSLINKINLSQHPVTIGRIDFHIDNFNVDENKLTGKEKIFFSDNVVLKSRDQQIMFPDGRHSLNYRKFRINLEQKIVEFDSCTIKAFKTDSSAAEFSIFFDELKMTNIDFDTLYRAEVIKADSVYAKNPRFKLNVDLDQQKKKSRQPLESIIRQLTGQLSLNFVIVDSASFDVVTSRNGNPSSFTSAGNNFEMQGFTITNDTKRPLRIEKFGMAIRNYENFLKDSLYALQFDSVFFNDDKIFLNNFSFKQLSDNGKTVNSFTIPRFLLTGLSWNDLIFDQRLKAKHAVLLKPVINYTQQRKKTRPNQKRLLFETLDDINDIVQLDDLNIVNGTINTKLSSGIEMNLQDATLSIKSQSLLQSDKLSGIRRSVNDLSFSKGNFKINDFNVQLKNVNYNGKKSFFTASSAEVLNDEKKIAATANGISLNEIFINEATGDISMNGVKWNNANIDIPAFFTKKEKKTASFVNLTDIEGGSTKIKIIAASKSINALVDHLSASAFIMKPGEDPIISGLSLSGNDLSINDKNLLAGISSFEIIDQHKASFSGIKFQQSNNLDSTHISIPSLQFTPSIQQMIAGNYHLKDISIVKPVIDISLQQKNTKVKSSFSFPDASITKLELIQPDIVFSSATDSSSKIVAWNGSKQSGNALVLENAVATDSAFTASLITGTLSQFILKDGLTKQFDAGKGEVKFALNNISYNKVTADSTTWKATVKSFDSRNFTLDSIGKKNGVLYSASAELTDLHLSNQSLGNLHKILRDNTSFNMQNITGFYTDSNTYLKWDNASYQRNNKSFAIDSFIYKPSITKEAFTSARQFQTDYIAVSTGKVTAGEFDFDNYLNDSIIKLNKVKINNFYLDDYRDQRLPFQSGIEKPLIAGLIKKIPEKIILNDVIVNDSKIDYTEINAKTGEAGLINISNFNLLAQNLKNLDYNKTDSLYIDASGYLMDSLFLRLKVNQSYTDSLGSFSLGITVNAADLTMFNDLLMPLAGITIKSGKIDSIKIDVKGNKEIARGKIFFFYKDLKVQVYKKPNEMGIRKKSGLLTFLANTLIKNKNDKHSYQIFLIRDKERSFINYFVKILFEGAKNTVLRKGDKKIEKKYRKELQQRNLSPLK